MVVNMGLTPVLRIEVSVRAVSMLHGGMIVLVAMGSSEMLPTANSLFLIRAVVRDVDVFVLVLNSIMDMCFDSRSPLLPG